MDAGLRDLLGELKDLNGSLTRVQRSASLRRLPDDESHRIQTQIQHLVMILRAARSALARSSLSASQRARLRKIIRDAVRVRKSMVTRQSAESYAKWLPLLYRIAQELVTLPGAAARGARTPIDRAAPAPAESAFAAAPPAASAFAPVPPSAPPPNFISPKDLPQYSADGVYRAPRYANTTVLDGKGRLNQRVSLERNQKIVIRIDIGPLSRDSHVSPGAAFPDKALPKDIDIDVMISSTDFAIGDDEGTGGSSVAHGRFFLPGNGDRALAPDGSPFVAFRLTAPARTGIARSRIGFYFRNTLVQSQQLTAAVGRAGGFKIVTDFTVSKDLTALDRIPDRPRLSVLTNLNQQGVHQIVLRAVDPHSAAVDARTFVVNEETVGATVGQIRTALAERAPASRQRRQKDLIQDLKKLAAPGWTLYTQLAAQNLDALDGLRKAPADYVIQVLRPTTSGFVIPWALMYEIPLLSNSPTVCPLISEWRETEPLITGSPRTCPHGPHLENVLCPFGFWGFRYAIEQLSSSDDPVLEIPASPNCSMVVAETQFQVDLAALETHVATLRALLQRALPAAELKEGKDKATIRTLLGQDLPIVYFFCHGQSKHIADPDTSLAVGKSEMLTAKDVIGWIVSWRLENKVIWNAVRPLIFVNACHSLAVYPTTLVSYLDAFVGTARAAGVIGTEVKVNPALASRFAERFFELLLTESRSVEFALRTIRFEFLAAGNLFGLVYTPYCWSDLKITRA
jgi:hypothetical protein